MALNEYVNHSSILKIKEYFNEHKSKKCTFKNITPKSLKCDIRVHEIVCKETFPKDFKNADATPVF